MESFILPQSGFGQHQGTGGFLDPYSVVNDFDINEGMKAADLGCGAGYFTILLAQRVGPAGKVYALDIVENALDNVRARANALGLNNVETVRTNLEILGGSGLPDGSQDFALLANILFQSNKKADIIREGRRILKNGGELVVIDWRRGGGGFGPPDNLRPDTSEIQALVEKESFMFERSINAGQFHFGLTFKKQQ